MTSRLHTPRRFRWLMAGPLLVILLAVALRLGFTADAAASRHGHARDVVPGSAGPHAAPRLARRARATQAAPAANWISSWGASPQGPSANNLSGQGFRFQTLRQIVSTSIGGSRVRIELSNAYGTRPLLIGGAAIAVQQSGAGLAAGTARQLTFGGQNSLSVPPGAEALSDPVTLPVKPLQRLAVSLYLPVRTGPATEHADAEETSFLGAGDRLSQLTAAGFSRRTGSWYYLDGVDVLAPRRELGAVVALGDSITDGVGSTPGGENRWPDYLARRLDARPGSSLAVVNEGIGGNRVLNDALCCGAGAVARFARDVRGRAGAREVILLEGVNDIGFSGHTGRLTAPHTSVSPAEIIAGDQQLVAQAHAAHLRIFGATLTPFRGARYWAATGEAKRAAVNAWIRTGGAFDGVIDFAKVLADPLAPEALDPAFDSGDHLHPNPAGYRRMAAAINLSALIRDAR